MEDMMINTRFFTGVTFPLISAGFNEANLSFITIRVCQEQKQLLVPGRIY